MFVSQLRRVLPDASGLLRAGLVVAAGLTAACDSGDGQGDSSDGSGGDAREGDGGADDGSHELPGAEDEDAIGGDADAAELRDTFGDDTETDGDGDAEVSDLDADGDGDSDADGDSDSDADGELAPDLDADMDLVDADLPDAIDADGVDGLEPEEVAEVDGEEAGDLIEEWPPAPWVRIGTGDTAWAPIRDGETLPVIIGFQGGYHVWGSLRATGVPPEGVEHEWALLDGSTVVAGTLWVTDLTLVGLGIFESSGVAVQFGPGLDPSSFEGRDLTLRVELRPSAGPVLSDSATIRVDCCF